MSRTRDLTNHMHDIGDEFIADLLSEIDLVVIDHHIHEVQDVEVALQCIDAGEFAVCINSGGEIKYRRLVAYPTSSRYCTCQKTL
jgi:DnaK suppressor protein